MRVPRHDKIIHLVHTHGFMSIEDLAQALHVTPQTMRRDINQLCDQHILRRYHGGAALGSSITSEDYHSRQNKFRAQKERIADLAAQAIPNESSLFLGIGTTVEAVARALTKNHKRLCIITNSIHVAAIASVRSDYSVMITSGVVRSSDGGITGVATLDFIGQFKTDFAILGVAAIEHDGLLFDYDYKEVSVTQAMMHNARKRFLVVDQSKYGRNALVRLGHLTDFDAVFSDIDFPEEIMETLNEHETALHNVLSTAES